MTIDDTENRERRDYVRATLAAAALARVWLPVFGSMTDAYHVAANALMGAAVGDEDPLVREALFLATQKYTGNLPALVVGPNVQRLANRGFIVWRWVRGLTDAQIDALAPLVLDGSLRAEAAEAPPEPAPHVSVPREHLEALVASLGDVERRMHQTTDAQDVDGLSRTDCQGLERALRHMREFVVSWSEAGQ